MSKFLDFPTVYGKLGNHPGLLTTDQAVALYQQGMKLPPGSSILEYRPDGGRSTVILAAVARNLNGRLYAVTDWAVAPPGAQAYFERAFKLHKLEQVAELDPADLPTAALTVARAAQPWQRLPGRVLVLGDFSQANGHAPAERGPGWAVFEHDEAYLAAVAEPVRVDLTTVTGEAEIIDEKAL